MLQALRKYCPYSEFFWSAFFRIWTHFAYFNKCNGWCKLVRIWTKFIDHQLEKQGAAMLLFLEGKG